MQNASQKRNRSALKLATNTDLFWASSLTIIQQQNPVCFQHEVDLSAVVTEQGCFYQLKLCLYLIKF